MKKYGILLILVCLMFVVGCVSGNYFKVPTEDETTDEENELIKEIQEIEKQLKEVEDDDFLDEDEEIFDEEETDEDDEEILDEDEEETDEDDEEILDEDEEELEETIDTSNLEKLSVQETDLVSLKVDVEDKDEDKVSYTFSKPLDSTGQWKTNYGDAGEYIVTITANDGKTTSEKNVLLVVEKKNVPPVIAGLESTISAKEGEVITLTPKVSDPNKDDVEITFPELFDGLGVWETDHTSAGEYDLTVIASDGELDAKFTIKLTVKDVNVPPEIDGLKKSITIDDGEKVVIEHKVTDLDGDKVTMTISEPIGDSGIWQTDFTDHGEYKVVVTANDGKDTVTFNIDLTVKDVNVAPEIIGVRLG